VPSNGAGQCDGSSCVGDSVGDGARGRLRRARQCRGAGRDGAGGEAEHGGVGLVVCGERLCAVGDGNQCYLCEKGGAYRCHTLDLPAECAAPARFWCDGPEDCGPGEQCIEDCELAGACALPGRVCRP
jgi:hypothetical protein